MGSGGTVVGFIRSYWPENGRQVLSVNWTELLGVVTHGFGATNVWPEWIRLIDYRPRVEGARWQYTASPGKRQIPLWEKIFVPGSGAGIGWHLLALCLMPITAWFLIMWVYLKGLLTGKDT